MLDAKDLTPQQFDELARRLQYRRTPQKIIWTAEAIGARIGRSGAFVRRTLAQIDGSPIRQIGHTYCAHEDELLDFFRSQSKTS